MRRPERKAAAVAALAELWRQGWKIQDAARELGIELERLSRMNKGRLAPTLPVLWRMEELAWPDLGAEVGGMVARVRELVEELRELDKVLHACGR